MMQRRLSRFARDATTAYASAVAIHAGKRRIPEIPVVALAGDVFYVYMVGTNKDHEMGVVYEKVGGNSLREMKGIYQFLHTVRVLAAYVKEHEAA
jgi:hypothetical protein